MGTSAFWTAEKIGALELGVAAGMSGSQIAAEIGCTRNMAIAKAYRMGLRLHGRPKPARPEPAQAPAAPDMRPCDVLHLQNNSCRWPITDGLPHLFCGSPTADVAKGVSYCLFHACVSYRRPSEAA